MTEVGSRQSWRSRPTVRSLKRSWQNDRDFERFADQEANDGTRLPESETLHLGCLILTEVFPPSKVASLYKVLERWPGDRERAYDPLEQLDRSRSGRGGGGWLNFGVVLPNHDRGMLVGIEATYDTSLPIGVEAVWLHLRFLAPSLAVVVATACLSEKAGDLADLMRTDYESEYYNQRVEVFGRLGALRARVPWARPARYRSRSSMRRAEDQKRLAVEQRIREHEQRCNEWFFARFPGRFATSPEDKRPSMRLLLTTEAAPGTGTGTGTGTGKAAWSGPAGISLGFPLWRSAGSQVWHMYEGRSRRFYNEPARDHLMVLSARRRDVIEKSHRDLSGTSNWSVAAEAAGAFSGLAGYQALRSLLSLYAERVSALRDSAGTRRRIARPVREARDLDTYLISDGLDAATVVLDVEHLTEDYTLFRYDVTDFQEDDRHWQVRAREPRQYLPELHSELKVRAQQLTDDTQAVSGTIQASAQLRQSIANTKLQRLTLVVSIAAAAIAVVSLLVSHGS